MAAGIRLNYNRTYADIGNINLDLGDDLTFDVSDYKYLEHEYTASGFCVLIWDWETARFSVSSMNCV